MDGFILNEVVHVQLLFVEKPVISQRKDSKKNRNGAIPHYFEWWCSMQSCVPINFGAPYLEQRIVIDWIVHVRVSFFTKPAANNHQSGLSPSFWVSKSWWHRSQKLGEVNFRRCFLILLKVRSNPQFSRNHHGFVLKSTCALKICPFLISEIPIDPTFSWWIPIISIDPHGEFALNRAVPFLRLRRNAKSAPKPRLLGVSDASPLGGLECGRSLQIAGDQKIQQFYIYIWWLKTG